MTAHDVAAEDDRQDDDYGHLRFPFQAGSLGEQNRGVGADRADTDAIRIYPVSVSLSPSQERAVRVNTQSGEPRPSTEEAYSISVELRAPGSETAEVISNVLLLVSQRTSPGLGVSGEADSQVGEHVKQGAAPAVPGSPGRRGSPGDRTARHR